jgi:hypothetical protein
VFGPKWSLPYVWPITVYTCDSIAQGSHFLWFVQSSQKESRGLTLWADVLLVHRNEPHPLLLSQKSGDTKCPKDARDLQILMAHALPLSTLNTSTTFNYLGIPLPQTTLQMPQH